jgi:hypothetical protein
MDLSILMRQLRRPPPAKTKQPVEPALRDWPSASGSLREGLGELFTINRLGLPSQLRRCLGTTNLIDNSHSAVRERTRRVKHWQTGAMALRWAAAAFEAASKNFRRIMGHEHLWMLRAALDDTLRDQHLAQQMRASSRRSTPQAANGTVNCRGDNFHNSNARRGTRCVRPRA